MKKKIFIIALVICVVVLSIASASTAYFTDVDEKTNTFTAGNVDITLTYANALEDTQSVYPSQNFDIDATITNVGSEKAYVGAIITLTKAGGISTIITPDGANKPVAIKDILVGLEASGYTVKYKAITGGYEVYVVNPAEVAKDGTAVIFTDIKIPAEWDNAEMTAFKDVKIKVKAYATQTVGFATNDAETALTTAFADWAAYSTLA